MKLTWDWSASQIPSASEICAHSPSHCNIGQLYVPVTISAFLNDNILSLPSRKRGNLKKKNPLPVRSLISRTNGDEKLDVNCDDNCCKVLSFVMQNPAQNLQVSIDQMVLQELYTYVLPPVSQKKRFLPSATQATSKPTAQSKQYHKVLHCHLLPEELA